MSEDDGGEREEQLQIEEALGGELACTHADEAQLETISDLNRRMHEESGKASSIDFFKTDMDFHTSIIAASGNAALMDTHAKYNARLWRARFLSSRHMLGRATTLQQHQDITDALLARNAENAAAAMRTHIETAIENLATQSDEQETSE